MLDSSIEKSHLGNNDESVSIPTAAFQKAIYILRIDHENMDTLQMLMSRSSFLVERIPNISEMTNAEFGKIRDLICVILSYLQNRVIIADGVTMMENSITSWRGKCSFATSAAESDEKTPSSTPTIASTIRDIENQCTCQFRLSSHGFIYFNPSHSCTPLKKSFLCYENPFSAYMTSVGYMDGDSSLWVMAHGDVVSGDQDVVNPKHTPCAEVGSVEKIIQKASRDTTPRSTSSSVDGGGFMRMSDDDIHGDFSSDDEHSHLKKRVKINPVLWERVHTLVNDNPAEMNYFLAYVAQAEERFKNRNMGPSDSGDDGC